MKNIHLVTKIAVLVSITLITFGCTKNGELQTNELTGDWRVVSFQNFVTSQIITKTAENTWATYNNGDITVNFNPTGSNTGVISGRNVTNTFSGKYIIDQKGKISINDVIWTEINEPEWGWLFHSIVNSESYEFRNGYLAIFYNQKKNSITFEKR